MNLTAYEIALIAGGFGIAGTLLGVWIAYRNALEIMQRQEFNKAVSDFRAAFAPAIVKFNLIRDAESIKKMLMEELVQQGVAIERFRPFIPSDKKHAYQETWEQYHHSHKRDGVSSVYFLDFAMGDEKERFKLFNERIHAILQFTE